MKRLSLLLLLILLYKGTFSQIAIGEWRDHLSYTYGINVEYANNKIYTLTRGGLFYLDLSTYSLEKLTKVNGLSDVGATTISYSAANDILIVGYSNGNIDLIANNTIYNLPDIKSKQMATDKTINNIYVENSTAYICTGFGIVLINLERKEVKDTYIIGPAGTYIGINDLDSDNDYFYAATDKGIYKAQKSNPGLVDFSNWSRIETIPNFSKVFKSIKTFNGDLYTFLDQTAWDGDTIYRYSNGIWEKFKNSQIKNVERIEVSSGTLFIVEPYRFYSLKEDGTERFFYAWVNGNSNPKDVVIGPADRMWIADSKLGLVYRYYSQESYYTTSPNGPITTSTYAIASAGNNVVAVAGGRNSAWNNMWIVGQFFKFENEQWKNFNTANLSYLSLMPDICSVTINPDNTNQYYLGSYGGGIIEMNGNLFVNHFNETNSSLEAISAGVRIGGMNFDKDGNLWVTNCGVDNAISVRKKDGSWKGFELFPYINAGEVAQIIITNNNHKWVVLPRGKGLFVFNDNATIDNSTDDEWLKFSVLDQNGELISNDIYSIAEDLENRIWLGTNKGIVVYYNPENVFTGESFYASQIKIPNENPGQANYLLEAQTVTAIAIDGANRKWIGTSNGGVFLMSADGTEQLLNFTEDNSPLFSNGILDITINQKSGEVFFVTDKGIISYKGTATMGDDYFSHVYTYPNPVPPRYTGYITIKGLAANVNVKITDISGNLVYETTSEGGQAQWNGNTLSGKRVSTGVYLVFVSNEDGTKTFTTKILFLN